MASESKFELIQGGAQSAIRPKPLTPREAQVVEMTWLTNTEIAVQLGNRPKTVKSLLRNAMAKLGAENRTHAYAIWEQQNRRAA